MFLVLAYSAAAIDLTSVISWFTGEELITFFRADNPERDDVEVSVFVVDEGALFSRTIDADDDTASGIVVFPYDGEDSWVRVRVRDSEGNTAAKYRPIIS